MKPQQACKWCGAPLEETSRAGRKPLYCKPSHRQRAYELRTLIRIVASANRRNALANEPYDQS